MKPKALLAAPVLALLLPVGGTPATAVTAAAGTEQASVRVSSPDGVIAKGCRGHRYRYAVEVPAGESWALTVSLVDKRGRTVASGYELSGGDAKKGSGRFRFCSIDVRPGRYKVKGELTWSHYSEEYHVRARPKPLQLRRP